MENPQIMLRTERQGKRLFDNASYNETLERVMSQYSSLMNNVLISDRNSHKTLTGKEFFDSLYEEFISTYSYLYKEMAELTAALVYLVKIEAKEASEGYEKTTGDPTTNGQRKLRDLIDKKRMLESHTQDTLELVLGLTYSDASYFLTAWEKMVEFKDNETIDKYRNMLLEGVRAMDDDNSKV